MCRASPQKKEVLFLSFTQIGIFDGVVWLCLSAGTYDKTCLQNGSGK